VHDFADFVSPGDYPPRMTEYAMEIFFPILVPGVDEEVFACSYVYRAGDRDMVAVTSWGDRLGGIIEMFFGKYSEFGHIYAEEFASIWPTIVQLAENTKTGNTDAGAFGQLIDPVDGTEKWVVAVTRNNVREELLDNEMELLAEKVSLLSVHVYLEGQTALTWKMKARLAARGGAAGFRKGKKVSDPIENALNWVQIVVGG